jgi:S1-C subfamily serine protease
MRMPTEWKVLALVITTILGPAASPRASELSPPEIYQRVAASSLAVKVVTHKGERFIGAAFLAFRSDCAITAWHLVQDAAQINATFSDGTSAGACEIIAQDPSRDLAILRVPASHRVPLPLNLETPPIASRLYAIGSPRGYTFSISDGLLSQIQMIDGFPQYQLTCPFSPGNSGGPVVNSQAEVVGVSAWSKVGAQNLNFAIPAQFVAALAGNCSLAEGATVPATTEARNPENVSGPAPAAGTSSSYHALGDFSHLQELLKSLAGREVRVTVEVAGKIHGFVGAIPSDSAEPPAGADRSLTPRGGEFAQRQP